MVLPLVILQSKKTVKITFAVNNDGTQKDIGDELAQENSLTRGTYARTH